MKIKAVTFEVILKLVGIVVGLVVAWLLLYLFTDAAGETKVILTLITTCATLLIIESVRISQKTQEQSLKIQEQNERLCDLSRVLSEKSLTEAKRAALLQAAQRQLKDSQLFQAWLELLWAIERSYQSTNYIPSSEIYEHGYGKCALSIQTVKKEVRDIPITKIFICNNDNEHQEISKTMKIQKDAGFTVRHIPYDKIFKHAHLQPEKHGVETIDFAIFDSETVLLWFLDPKTRLPVGGRILIGTDNVSRYIKFFNMLFQESTPFAA